MHKKTKPTDAAVAGDEQPATNPVNASPPSKISVIKDLLFRNDGASLDELTAATGWLPHTIRAALTGLRKKGYGIERFASAGVTRWRIAYSIPDSEQGGDSDHPSGDAASSASAPKADETTPA
jgi:hypothetical protein